MVGIGIGEVIFLYLFSMECSCYNLFNVGLWPFVVWYL
jgi:hypothetical protein